MTSASPLFSAHGGPRATEPKVKTLSVLLWHWVPSRTAAVLALKLAWSGAKVAFFPRLLRSW